MTVTPSQLLREPLVHFLAAGAVLFAGYITFNRGVETAPEKSTQQIRITAGDVTWLSENWTRQWRRPPTQDELRGLVRDHVNEQLLAREARALGLEDNDVIIRRRLAQKLSFIIEDTSRRADPTDDELRTFHQTHRERFRTEASISFRHVYFDSTRRADAETDARELLKTLLAEGGAAEGSEAGDRFLIDMKFEAESQQSVAGIFGPDFAKSVFSLTPGLWSGPIPSGYGLHLVRVSHLRGTEPLSLAEGRDRVLADWRREQEWRAKGAYLESLRRKYEVAVDDSVAPLLANADRLVAP